MKSKVSTWESCRGSSVLGERQAQSEWKVKGTFREGAEKLCLLMTDPELQECSASIWIAKEKWKKVGFQDVQGSVKTRGVPWGVIWWGQRVKAEISMICIQWSMKSPKAKCEKIWIQLLMLTAQSGMWVCEVEHRTVQEYSVGKLCKLLKAPGR